MDKDPSILIIDPKNIQKEYLKDLFRYKELFYFFCWRDTLVRYKQAIFGIAWALIRPILHMLVFTLVFSKVAKLSSNNVNYPLFVLAGMLPWQLFSNAIMDCSNSIINNSHLITKTYFPRMLIPGAQIIVHFTDFCVGTTVLLLALIFMGYGSLLSIIFFPIFIALTLILCLGCGLWLSALTVKYRDFKFIVPFLIQFGVFVSPVGYGTFSIPEKYQIFYFANPMVGIIDGCRWSLFGITYPGIAYSILFSIVINLSLLITGFRYFRKMETSFADGI
ncbi:MAG: phosphate ABC transporter permease [Chlamydia sp. 32-24]|nr:MAG: phosphate ABC transporter permease [Chlamydia sp. 32-24]